MTKETFSLILSFMDKIEASRQAIDAVGTAELVAQLEKITGESVSIFAVRKWRQRGIPGEWVPAVCAITGADQKTLNPLVPDGFAA